MTQSRTRRVRFLQSVVLDGAAFQYDEQVDLPVEVARVWADGFRAEYVRDERTERATRQGGETRTR